MEFHEICVYFFPKIEEKFGVPNFVMNKSYLYRYFLLLKYLGMVYQSNLETCPKRGEPTGGDPLQGRVSAGLKTERCGNRQVTEI